MRTVYLSTLFVVLVAASGCATAQQQIEANNRLNDFTRVTDRNMALIQTKLQNHDQALTQLAAGLQKEHELFMGHGHAPDDTLEGLIVEELEAEEEAGAPEQSDTGDAQ